jgi:hypothetical protein
MGDGKVAAAGGMWWPTPRSRMTEEGPIVERMKEDLAAHHRAFPDLICNLSRFGWTVAQCARYGHIARARYADAADPIHLVHRAPLGQPDPAPVGTPIAPDCGDAA